MIDLSNVDWYAYVPNGISFGLILMSGLAERSYGRKIGDLTFKGPVMQGQKESIKNIALDWGNRQGFISSMVASLFSVFSILSRVEKSQQFTLVFIAVGILVLTFAIMHYWALGRRAGEWQDTLKNIQIGSGISIKVNCSLVANAVLIAVNIILIGLIAIAGADSSAPAQMTPQVIPSVTPITP